MRHGHGSRAIEKRIHDQRHGPTRHTGCLGGFRIFPFILGHSVIPLGPVLIERYTSLLNY